MRYCHVVVVTGAVVGVVQTGEGMSLASSLGLLGGGISIARIPLRALSICTSAYFRRLSAARRSMVDVSNSCSARRSSLVITACSETNRANRCCDVFSYRETQMQHN